MRKHVAMFGTFGYELDPTKLTSKEKKAVKQDILDYKRYQELICSGDFYRLETTDENQVAWMVVSQDKNEALVGYYQILARPNPSYERIRLLGLAKEKEYSVSEGDKKTVRYGKDLETIGLILNENYIGREQEYWSRTMPGDFHSRVFHLTAR